MSSYCANSLLPVAACNCPDCSPSFDEAPAGDVSAFGAMLWAVLAACSGKGKATQRAFVEACLGHPEPEAVLDWLQWKYDDYSACVVAGSMVDPSAWDRYALVGEALFELERRAGQSQYAAHAIPF
jgi:hypothetical protein